MFKNLAYFFIKNSKLTIVLILVSIFVWIASYFSLPKQYNPTIVVPAFEIQIPANWLSAEEVSTKVVSPIENLLYELEGIDEVYWYSYDNFAWLMAKFEVWVDSENAKIRLIQKINDNILDKPKELGDPIIKSIDPEDLSQITYSINYIWDDNLSNEEKQIYLKQIANLIKQEVKKLSNITTIEIVWWYSKNIVIDLDLDKLQARNVDILQIYNVLEKYNFNMPSGNIISNNEKIFVWIDSRVNKIEDIKKIIVFNNNWKKVYLEDISDIRYWVSRVDSYTKYSNYEYSSNSVLIWFGKKRWTNAVVVTNNVKDKVLELSETLPKDIEIKMIQNEWKTASDATTMLLTNLFQSFLIVFVILAFYLWVKNAFNTAASIPLTLALVFFLALLVWDNINKITLFALILVLWMIVDNSTVVVENISRHLDERVHTWKTKLEAVLEWVQEVGFWVIMATITRLLAFGSMFAVTGMMWEYMWPIPKYAIFALLISLLISLTLNPWISYVWAKEVTESDREEHEKKSWFDPRKYYLSFMKIFINNDKKWFKNRKIFKIVFWITLFSVIIAPIYLSIFKARMLPKSDQDQIYIWVDAPRSYSASKMYDIEQYMSDFFFDNEKLPENLDIASELTTTIWNSFVWDFANLFRGWSQRFWENQISSRLNLLTNTDIDDRVTSEYYTINIRDIFKDYMLTKYPELEIRLQEDPPGPPVMSTFRINIKWTASQENLDNFMLKTQSSILQIKDKYSLVDLGNSNNTTYRKLNLKVDHVSASNAWITTSQISSTLGVIFSDAQIGLIKNNDSFDYNFLVLAVDNKQKDTTQVLKNIYLTNIQWKKIPLDSLVNIEYSFVSDQINTKDKQEIKTIYAEMWDDSLVYPVIKLFKIFLSDDFVWKDYELLSWSPYEINYKWLSDWKIYTIEWWWEWELTVDTFRDLWIAMMLSLLAIYFLLVWQFSSFKIAWIIMTTFLLSFFWVFPWFTALYLFNNEYFSATSMIWIIALWWIVVWNAIILIDYLNILKKNGLTMADALLKAWYARFAPIILTSLTTVFWAATIIWDPVWSGLARTVIWWLLFSSILTLIVIPIFYYDSQKSEWEKCAWIDEKKC